MRGKSNSKTDIYEEFERLQNIISDVSSMRTHGLVQSTDILSIANAKFGIEVDTSLFMPFSRISIPTINYFSETSLPMVRLPFTFEDDVFCHWPGKDWNARFSPPQNFWILAFHPIHVALNSSTLHKYDALKESLEGTPLYNASWLQCERFVNSSELGVRTLLENFLKEKTGQSSDFTFNRVSELGRYFLRNKSVHSFM